MARNCFSHLYVSAALAATLVFSSTAWSQQVPDASTTIDDQGTATVENPSLRGLVRGSDVVPVASDGPVDASSYFVGPGDLLSVHIFWNSPVENQLVVSAEGTLLVPNVGAIDLRDLTLADAKKKVADVIRKKYVHTDATVTLIKPRRITVEVIGNVIDEGRKEISAIQKVDYLIALSNRFPEQRMEVADYAKTLSNLRMESSERRITVKSRNGDVRRVDLAKFRATGSDKDNPFLRDGDIVYVPIRQVSDFSLGVYGGVMNPARFEFIPGDSLTDLVAMALGFRPETDPHHATLTRLSQNGHEMDTMTIDAQAVVDGKAPNIALRPGDRLVIPTPVDPRQDYRVVVAGEVRKPGAYPISRDRTRLSEILRAAGGLTSLANAKGGIVFRQGLQSTESASSFEIERLRNLRTATSEQDSSYFLAEMALRFRVGEKVSVDIEKALSSQDTTQDIILRPDDRIEIPRRQQTVYVFGQVVSPGHVPFVADQDYMQYVQLAGGFTKDARESDVKIIKKVTRDWLDPSETIIEDGDMVWIPREIHHPFTYYLTAYAQIIGIIGSVATVALLIRSFQ